MDLRDFFPSFAAGRIQAFFFGTLGYPESVAVLLAGICTTTTPPSVRKRLDASSVWIFCKKRAWSIRTHLYRKGAPTSPACRQPVSHRVDCRLHGLALATAVGAAYTR